MLADIDLKSSSGEQAVSGAKTKKKSASAAASDIENNDDQHHTATIPLSQSQEGSTSRRIMLRGKPSYHFHMKRPRRNVKKRSIVAAQLQNIEEHKEMLMGMDTTQQNERRDGRGHRSDDKDQYRAPRVALVLFLLVCTAGGYRGFSQYWSARNSDAAAGARRVARMEGGEDGTRSFFRRAGEDDEHREALLLAADGLEGLLGGGENVTEEENIEDIPTTLFDETIEAPQDLSNLVNIFHEHYNPNVNKLFLWHIPRSGTTTIKRIASYCMGLTIASEAGKTEMARAGGGDGSTIQELRIVEGLDGVKFAAVDLSYPDGIAIAKSLNVGLSDRVDLVSSPYLWDTAGIFDGYHKGYMVAMFRHPIERATSLYFSMRKNPQYEKQVGSLSSIEQYAKSSLVENNWMTRFLSNTLSGELTPQHEAIAKEVLRTKCLIGLLRDKTETMRRLEVLFNLKAKEKRSKRREECQEKLLYWDWPGKNRHEPVVSGEAWDILHKHNTFDLRLYEYAEKLFKAQGKLFQDTPSAW